VVAYELGEEYIKVKFRRRAEIYVYDGEAPGMSGRILRAPNTLKWKFRDRHASAVQRVIGPSPKP
jgi:hypothetical protein